MNADALGNAPHWDGTMPGFREAWSLTTNHAASGTGYQLRYTVQAPSADASPDDNAPYACLWFARFDARMPARTFGVHRRFPLAAVTSTAAPFAITMGPDRLTDGSARGALAGDGHDVRWDLCWTPSTTPLALVPDIGFRGTGIGQPTRSAPSPRVALTGEITIDRVRLRFDGELATQDHAWGRRHATRWAYGRCTGFDEQPGAALDVASVRVRQAGLPLPPLTVLTLQLDDETLALGQLRHLARNRARWDTGVYRFEAAGLNVRIVGELTCRPDQMLMAPLDHPTGEVGYAAQTAVADARVTVSRRVGVNFREAAVLTATGRAHLEVGQPTRDRLVARSHRRID